MSRSFVALTLLIASVLVLGAWHPAVLANDRATVAMQFVADGDENENVDENKPHVRAKDAGSIEGEVVSVDYRTNRMIVRSGTTTYDVTVLPSTDFRGRTNSFHGFTDIKRGAHVDVMLSQRAQTLTAQIIHLH